MLLRVALIFCPDEILQVDSIAPTDLGHDIVSTIVESDQRGSLRLDSVDPLGGKRRGCKRLIDENLRSLRVIDDKKPELIEEGRLPHFFCNPQRIEAALGTKHPPRDLEGILCRIGWSEGAAGQDHSEEIPPVDIGDKYVPVAVPGVEARARSFEALSRLDGLIGRGFEDNIRLAVRPNHPEEVRSGETAKAEVGDGAFHKAHLVVRPCLDFHLRPNAIQVVLAVPNFQAF